MWAVLHGGLAAHRAMRKTDGRQKNFKLRQTPFDAYNPAYTVVSPLLEHADERWMRNHSHRRIR